MFSKFSQEWDLFFTWLNIDKLQVKTPKELNFSIIKIHKDFLKLKKLIDQIVNKVNYESMQNHFINILPDLLQCISDKNTAKFKDLTSNFEMYILKYRDPEKKEYIPRKY